jgi:hypothetical protein
VDLHGAETPPETLLAAAEARWKAGEHRLTQHAGTPARNSVGERAPRRSARRPPPSSGTLRAGKISQGRQTKRKTPGADSTIRP